MKLFSVLAKGVKKLFTKAPKLEKNTTVALSKSKQAPNSIFDKPGLLNRFMKEVKASDGVQLVDVSKYRHLYKNSTNKQEFLKKAKELELF